MIVRKIIELLGGKGIWTTIMQSSFTNQIKLGNETPLLMSKIGEASCEDIKVYLQPLKHDKVLAWPTKRRSLEGLFVEW